MASTPLEQVFQNLSERIDEDLLPVLYEAASVPTVVIRAELEAAGLAWSDPSRGRSPSVHELRLSAEAVIQRSTRRATIRGALASTMGLLAVPPELAAAFVQTLRLAQRLVVVFGHEHESDRGKLILGRVLAAGLEIELPEQARVDFRVQGLPAMVRQEGQDQPRALERVARFAGRRVVVGVGTRIGRSIPGFGLGIGAWSARRQLRKQAARMLPVLEASWEGVPWPQDAVEEVVELPA